MQLNITNSANLTVLDSQIIADMCAGKFFIDLTPTVWIGSGASNVLGAKIKITNPFGVDVKPFPSSGYDIVSPMTGVLQFNIPTQSNNFQYGLYVITVELTDANGTKYTISDNISLCEPNPADKTKKYGNINAQIIGNCKEGRVTIMLDEPPVYKGKMYESKTQSFTLDYPTASGLPQYVSTTNAFSVALFEGEYKVKGDSCVTYNFGDNNYIKVPYKINCTKKILCLVDLCCVYDKIDFINHQIVSSCKEEERLHLTDVIFDALRLLKTIELGAACGIDVSDYIDQLEQLLGCRCSCSATEGTPIVNNTPSTDFSITGCGVSKVTVGNTDVYTIDNFDYLITTNPANSFLTISAPALTSCVKKQQLSFSVSSFYAELKALITTNISTETVYWATIINPQLNNLPDNLLTCLGYASDAWDALTYRAKWLVILTKFCGCCSGASCDAVIAGETLTQSGGNELITWNNVQNVFAVDIYIDGSLIQTVLGPINSYLAAISGLDSHDHTYKLIAKCSNGAQGNILEGTFTNSGCATIPPVSLSSSNVTDADCPYDLTGLYAAAGAGYTYEWHNENNRNPASLVPDPTAVSSGNYWVFAIQNSTGCASVSSHVSITCHVDGDCTEPLSLSAVVTTGTNILVSFSSAATPPPTYLVKRRLASDPDITGSYTTIGAPTFNSGTNKWEITDTTAAANTLYVYMAESQCADSSRPNAQYTYANITCPAMTYTPGDTTMGYSFTNVGGGIDKYEIKIFDQTASILIHTDTKTPAFASPITGTFTGLSVSTQYRLMVRAYIGTYYKDCPLSRQTTTSGDVGTPLTVNLIRSGAPSGTLTAFISGGTPPYSYTFNIVGVGTCEAHTIDDPTGTVADDTGVTTAFTTTAYSGTTYNATCVAVDAVSANATSNTVTLPACLVPETMIKMKDGSEKELGSLKVGDELFGENNKIESFNRHKTEELYIINGGTLRASAGHIHIVNGDTKKPSIDLVRGDKLPTFDGGEIEIYNLGTLTGEFEVIDISTTNQTFVANKVLTHNKLACP